MEDHEFALCESHQDFGFEVIPAAHVHPPQMRTAILDDKHDPAFSVSKEASNGDC